MKRAGRKILEYLNPELERDIAEQENLIMCKRLTLTGLLGCLLSLLCVWINSQKLSYASLLGACGFILLGGLFLVNRDHTYRHTTRVLELFSGLILLTAAYIETSANRKQPVFIVILLLMVIPPLIMEKPWKLLVLIGASVCITFFFSYLCAEEEIFAENLNRLIPAAFISCVFTCHTAHNRLRMINMHKSVQSVADRDPLTGILNRGGGSLMIRNCVAQQISGTFMIIDVDDFKNVNDNYGHQCGDEVLKKVAGALQSSFKTSDIVMRLGGDEFVVYVAGMADYQVAQHRLETLVERIRQIRVDDRPEHSISVSIGGIINDGSYPDYDALYRAADKCLYKAKKQGKNCFVLYGISYRKNG